MDNANEVRNTDDVESTNKVGHILELDREKRKKNKKSSKVIICCSSRSQLVWKDR